MPTFSVYTSRTYRIFFSLGAIALDSPSRPTTLWTSLVVWRISVFTATAPATIFRHMLFRLGIFAAVIGAHEHSLISTRLKVILYH